MPPTIARERGYAFVPSFHRDLVIGVATYAHEFFTAVADLDTVYVPIGLGSGICGMIGMRDALGLSTRIVGVVAQNANAYALSFAAGHVVPDQCRPHLRRRHGGARARRDRARHHPARRRPHRRGRRKTRSPRRSGSISARPTR